MVSFRSDLCPLCVVHRCVYLCVRKAVFARQHTNGLHSDGLSLKSLVVCVYYDVLCHKKKDIFYTVVVIIVILCKHRHGVDLSCFLCFFICLEKSLLSTVICAICVTCLHVFFLSSQATVAETMVQHYRKCSNAGKADH